MSTVSIDLAGIPGMSLQVMGEDILLFDQNRSIKITPCAVTEETSVIDSLEMEEYYWAIGVDGDGLIFVKLKEEDFDKITSASFWFTRLVLVSNTAESVTLLRTISRIEEGVLIEMIPLSLSGKTTKLRTKAIASILDGVIDITRVS